MGGPPIGPPTPGPKGPPIGPLSPFKGGRPTGGPMGPSGSYPPYTGPPRC